MTPCGVFVTGTDTEVGKTVASVALLHGLARAGRRVAGMKPVASGSERTPGGLRNADALALQAAANVALPYAALNPYAFEPAIAPHIAAREAGVQIRFETILRRFRDIRGRGDAVVVEGVGGWRVPLGADGSVAELAAALGLPVVLVVAVRLGCINHACLTAASVLAVGLPLAGWIASFPDPGGERREAQIETLDALIPAPRLGVLPWSRRPLAEELCARLDLSHIL